MSKVTGQSELLELGSLQPDSTRKAVKRAYRSIRSDRVRTVFSELLQPYFQALPAKSRSYFFGGINVLDKATLERARLFRERISLRGVLLLVIERDVPSELARETIESLSVLGFISASDEVWEVLADRCRKGVRLN